MNRRRLAAAYLRTRYRVALDPPADLRIGVPDAAARRVRHWCRGRGCGLLTACNPRSRRLSTLATRRREPALLRLLRARRLRHLPARSDPDGRWTEPGVIVCARRERLLTLGRRLRQNALVWCAPGRAPRLQWL